MHVLIPAYQPNRELVYLVEGLIAARPSIDILIVDDGSDSDCLHTFASCVDAGARVLRLETNGGKGHALRAGFEFLHGIRARGPIVTADADGQHAIADILRVADAVDDTVMDGETPGAARHLVLGERQFEGEIPLRSRVGNDFTRLMFRAATGVNLRDTQTGLRAFPAALLPWLLNVRGDRYEYELVMLLQAARQGIELRRVPIQTIYLDDNASSHFRPIADSVRIYAPLLTFIGSSLVAFAVDTVALLVLNAVLGMLLPAVVLARLISGSVNFTMNRRFVFPGVNTPAAKTRAAVRYAGLAGALLLANYLVLSSLYAIGTPLLLAKVLTEIALVATSYVVQARFVFAGKKFDLSTRRLVDR